tara:strand:+ start:1147 stop:1368 length:222 start_codon:yes stop_codon:yes gene_type:complete
MLKADGFDEAIVGMTYDVVVSEDRLIYSIDKCIEILVKRDDMTPEDAIEYLEFNTLCAYVGKDTPVFLREYEE